MAKKLLCATMAIGLFLTLTQFIQAQEVLYLSHYDFKGATDNEDVSYLGRYLYKYSSIGWLHAPVHLPQGAIIQGIHLICLDNSSLNIECCLSRMATWSGTYESIFQVFSSGEADFIRRFATWVPLVGNSRSVTKAYSYVVNVYFPDYGEYKFQLYGIRIQYQLPDS